MLGKSICIPQIEEIFDQDGSERKYHVVRAGDTLVRNRNLLCLYFISIPLRRNIR
jgi:hypothetical protein